jgi:uncharacterized membrane protein YgdD (TMEM256/DUF423 family)
MFHALALFGVALLASRDSARAIEIAGWCFAVGSVLFCGLLYVMALGGPKWLGAVVPVGGLAFMAGWLALVAYAWKRRV